MLKAHFKKHILNFKFDAGTSRGVLKQRPVWYLRIEQYFSKELSIIGIGEVAPIQGLSIEDVNDVEEQLQILCAEINNQQSLDITVNEKFPSIQFALEIAVKDLQAKGKRVLFDSKFVQGKVGIPINGLVWMGDKGFMFDQIKQKLNAGFRCVKIKIGAINFQEELKLIKYIRSQFSPDELEIRTDANGAFSTEQALEKIKVLSAHYIHSIEQPIKQGQWEEMAELVEKSPIPVALDEELIGVNEEQDSLLKAISPNFLILKPSLLGGFAASEQWIKLAEKNNIGWWVTSALESNIGLNAIAQWTYNLNNKQYQGLGTGQLYTNNISSPLFISQAMLKYNPDTEWDLSLIL